MTYDDVTCPKGTPWAKTVVVLHNGRLSCHYVLTPKQTDAEKMLAKTGWYINSGRTIIRGGRVIIKDKLEVCDNCAIVIANDDWSGIEPDERIFIESGLEEIYKIEYPECYLVSGPSEETIEFSKEKCEICGALPGRRNTVYVLQQA
jgi:hypothetical protein